MKVLLSAFLLFTCAYSQAQTVSEPVNDTSVFPYWIEMMRHPEINLFQTQRAFELYWKNRPVLKGSGYKVFKRWEYMAKLHSDGKGNITMPKPLVEKPGGIKTNTDFFETGAYGLTSFDSTVKCYNDSFWVELGPKFVKDIGRINAIAFHPTDTNIILAGAASGGLWKTTNGGLNWTMLVDSLPTLGVSAIAYDYSNPDIIYLGTGDIEGDAFGYGLYKSIDGGKSWLPFNNGITSFSVVMKIIIDLKNPNIVLLGTNTGIYRSVNKGKNWKASSISGASGKVDIVMNERFRNIVYVSTSGNFYKSVDSGKSFIKVTKGIGTFGYYSSVAYTPNDSSYVYFLQCDSKEFTALYRSTNFGDSFVMMSNSPNLMGYQYDGSDAGNGQAFYCKDLAVSPTNKNEVYVGGVNIFRSLNGGKTWTINAHWLGDHAPVIHADIHALEYSPLKKVLYSANDGGIYKYTNGKTWTSISNGMGVRQAYKISTCKEGLVIGGFQDNGTDMTKVLDSKLFIGQTGGDGMDNCIDSKNPNIYYTSIYYGTIYQNGSAIAGKGANGINEDGDWVTPFTLQENNPNIMLAGYYNIWRSNNLNAHTAIAFKNICDANSSSASSFVFDVESSPANNNHFYFCRANGTFYKTSNLNATNPSWVNMTSKKPHTGLIRDIQCDYKDTNKLYIAIESAIYKSVNGGNSWINYSSTLPDVMVYSIAIDSSDKHEALYCGTSSGVYYTDTLLKKWVRYKNNFPKNVKVLDLEISFGKTRRSSRRLFAGTYGRGIWSATLKDYMDEMPRAKFGMLGFKPYDANDYYIFNRTCLGGRLLFYDSSEGLNLKHKWVVVPNKGVVFENNDSISPDAKIYFNLPGKYKVIKMVKNCIGNDTFFYDDIIILDTVKSSCHGTTQLANSAGDYGVDYLQLNGFSMSCKNTKDGGEYIDLICKGVYRVKSGRKYKYASEVNSVTSEYFKLYIDYNDDGAFSESTELVTSAHQQGLFIDSLYISGKSVKNKLLRMRLISDYMPIDSNGCPNLIFGHTVDFGIVIEGEDKQDFKADKSTTCLGSSVLFSDLSTGLPVSYLWDFGSGASPQTVSGMGPHMVSYSTSGYKNVKLTIDNKIVKKKDSFIYVQPRFKNLIGLFNSDSVLCKGEELSISSKLDSANAFQYTWKKDGIILGKVTKNIAIKKVIAADSGFYTLLTADNCYKDTSNQLKVVVEKLPDATFKQVLVSKYNYQFTPVVLNYKNYLWNFGDGKNSSVIAPAHDFVSPNKYKVVLIVKSKNDCTDSSTVLLDVKKDTRVPDLFIGSVSITPNPVKDEIFIRFNLNTPSEVAIEILQADGRFVQSIYNGHVDEKSFEWSTDLHQYGLNAGIYLINIRVNNQDNFYKIILL